MKAIFYILSLLVILGAAYFTYDTSNKIQTQITAFDETRNTKIRVQKSIADEQDALATTKDNLKTAENKLAELKASLENEKSKQTQYQKSIAEYEAEIEGHDAQLKKFAEVMAEIKEKIGDLDWDEVGPKIDSMKEERKTKGNQLEELELLVTKLTAEVNKLSSDRSKANSDLTEIRDRIKKNAVEGRIEVVDSTWGFVVVSLGTKNSNVTPQSKLLIRRDGRVLGTLQPNSVEPMRTVCDLNARDIRPGVRILPGDTVTLADSVGN